VKKWIASAALAGALAGSPASAQSALDVTVLWRGRPASGAVVELIRTNDSTAVSAADTVFIDQLHLRFTPNILAIPVGTTVEFQNSDQVMHNVFSPARRGDDFDLGTYPEGESRYHTFDEAGSFVVLCHVHPEMAAWVVVSEGIHVGATDPDGQVRFDDVEPGTYRVVGWLRRRVVHDAEVSISPQQTTLTTEMGR
jgi:plastocyanin